MSLAHLNIGANIGHRADAISRAVARISQLVGRVTAVSPVFESAPWGFESANSFLNAGVNVQTELEPEAILDAIKLIEQEIAPGSSHRTATGGYADREIDIDLICVDNLTVSTDRLQLPHPRMHMREFVLLPMARLLPQWHHPASGLTPDEMIAARGNKETPACVMQMNGIAF